MARLIDADALKNKLQQHHDFLVNAWGGFREMPIQDKARCDELSNSIAEIFNAPTVEIVRCKDCKWLRYCETEDLDFYLDCDQPDGGGIPRSEEWFCADGERREP